jgi:hypothetical protein
MEYMDQLLDTRRSSRQLSKNTHSEIYCKQVGRYNIIALKTAKWKIKLPPMYWQPTFNRKQTIKTA